MFVTLREDLKKVCFHLHWTPERIDVEWFDFQLHDSMFEAFCHKMLLAHYPPVFI